MLFVSQTRIFYALVVLFGVLISESLDRQLKSNVIETRLCFLTTLQQQQSEEEEDRKVEKYSILSDNLKIFLEPAMFCHLAILI